MPKARKKSRRPGSVAGIYVAKFCLYLTFLAVCEPHVHRHQDREHYQREERWPLEQKAKHDEDETRVLRVAYVGIRPGHSERMRSLRFVEYIPGGSKQKEPSEDYHVAQQMERIEVRITLPAHQCFPEVARIVRKQVDTRESAAQPPGQQVDGQGEPIHLGKERHYESRECAKGAPIAACSWT